MIFDDNKVLKGRRDERIDGCFKETVTSFYKESTFSSILRKTLWGGGGWGGFLGGWGGAFVLWGGFLLVVVALGGLLGAGCFLGGGGLDGQSQFSRAICCEKGLPLEIQVSSRRYPSHRPHPNSVSPPPNKAGKHQRLLIMKERIWGRLGTRNFKKVLHPLSHIEKKKAPNFGGGGGPERS